MARYIHPHSLVPWEWLYQATIYPPPTTHGIDYKDIIFSLPRKSDEGVNIYRNVIFSFPTIFGGGDYIVTLYFHPWQYLVRGWLYHDIIFSLLIILVRGWLYCDIIFSLLTIFGKGVIISWHYIFTPDNIWSGGDYIKTQYSHPWQHLVRGWIYRDIIFSLLTIFREGGIISWHILTPDNIWSWGWLYCDMFSLLSIFGQGVIISWHYIFTPGNIWWGGDYILTYFHSWQYLVRGWIYHDIIFSLLIIFGEGWL